MKVTYIVDEQRYEFETPDSPKTQGIWVAQAAARHWFYRYGQESDFPIQLTLPHFGVTFTVELDYEPVFEATRQDERNS